MLNCKMINKRERKSESTSNMSIEKSCLFSEEKDIIDLKYTLVKKMLLSG